MIKGLDWKCWEQQKQPHNLLNWVVFHVYQEWGDLYNHSLPIMSPATRFGSPFCSGIRSRPNNHELQNLQMSSVQSTTKELLNYSQTPFFVGEGGIPSDPAALPFSILQKKPRLVDLNSFGKFRLLDPKEHIWVVPKIGVPPKWMVYNGNPY